MKLYEDAKFEKQLRKTTQLHMKYDAEKEKLKDFFYDRYPDAIISSLLEVVRSKGNFADKTMADNFEKDYRADNFDDTEIEWFKKVYRRYNESFLEQINEGEEDQ